MARTLREAGSASVMLLEDSIMLQDFEEKDPDVFDVVSATEDEEEAIHGLLQVGARCTKVAQVNLDASVLEHAVNGLTSKFDSSVNEAVGQITGITEALFSEENGDVRKILDGVKEEITAALEGFSDPDSKKSAVSKIEAVLDLAAAKQEKAIRRVIDPSSEDSPLRSMRLELEQTIHRESKGLMEAVNDLSERLAVAQARSEAKEKTAIKGFDFEDQVHEVVVRAAANHEDVAEQVGNITGMTGGKAGDEVVALNLEDTRGASARYTLECKDRKLTLRKTLDELTEAMENRDALAGIAVFSSEDRAPIHEPFQPFGDKAVVVLDKDDPDERALRLACLWARWVVRRQLSEQGDGVDLERISSLIEDGRRALGQATTVKRALSGARKKVEESEGHLDSMLDGLEAVFDDICAELESATGESAEPIYLAPNGTEGGGQGE